MKEIADKALLYDFYGPLLTSKQGKIWDLYYQQDYSLAEIAEQEGISRQAVHDLLKRTEKILANYEHKLNLVVRFLRERQKITSIEALLQEMKKRDFSSETAWRRQQKIQQQIEEMLADAMTE